jgi:nucleoside-diphosphate-sugar epimerase
MRVVVLGGTRFIGRALVDDLVAAGHEPLVVHRGRHEPPDLPDVPHLHVDRALLPERVGDLRRFRPDALVDLSAMTAADADGALQAAPPGVRIVVASSIDVYRAANAVWNGTVSDSVPLDERSPLRRDPPAELAPPPPGWDFDLRRYEKLDVERAYLGRGATVCRLPLVYGEHDYKRREDFILRRVRAGRRRIPFGAGSWLWSRGYVDDVAAGLRLALETDRVGGEVFNLCEPRCASVRQWAQQILAAAEHEAELVRVPDDALPADLEITAAIPQHWLTTPAKAQALLEWRPRPAEDTVPRSVRWHLDNPSTAPDPGFAEDERALSAAVV